MSSNDTAQFRRLGPECGLKADPGHVAARQPEPRTTTDLNRRLQDAATRPERRAAEETKSEVGSIQLGIAAAGQVIVDLSLAIGRLESRLGVVLQPEAPLDAIQVSGDARPRTELANRLDSVLGELRCQVRRLSALTDQIDL